MSLNATPNSERAHVCFFGSTNAGKSSLANAVTNQPLSVVSPVSGTTTDPVKKAMELLPYGPVVIVDTPGFDDVGELGELRVAKTKEVLEKTDLAVLVTTQKDGFSECDATLISLFKSFAVPYIVARNKSDLLDEIPVIEKENEIYVSAQTSFGIDKLKELIAKALISQALPKNPLVSDLVNQNDLIVLVIPIDASAPKGRLILPQQMVIRDLLDKEAQVLVVKDTSLADTLQNKNILPSLVITDSQVFGKVSKLVPKSVPLTSFSILMSRYKGYLDTAIKGAAVLDTLKDSDKILISEGCSHHRQCEDIGTVKLPRWIKEYTGKNVEFIFTQGSAYPEDLQQYALIIHCGGCMLTEREVTRRQQRAALQNIPFTNYGTIIAKINGILDRSIEIFEKTVAK